MASRRLFHGAKSLIARRNLALATLADSLLAYLESIHPKCALIRHFYKIIISIIIAKIAKR